MVDQNNIPAGSRVAVIGAGISGVTASYLLQRRFAVTLFESEGEIGGHASTVFVQDRELGQIGIDIGFIVLNNRNYPNFERFLSELEVPTQASEMSFGFYSKESGFAYSGRSLNGLFANRSNILRPSFYRFLNQLRCFSRDALLDLEAGRELDGELGEYLRYRKVNNGLINNYLLPMGAAIWSCAESDVLRYPTRAFLAFFKNHGLLEFTNRPQWRTVTGGSRSYLRRFVERFDGTIRLNAAVSKVTRGDKVVVTNAGGEEEFDYVVFATHAPQTLKMLASPSSLEAELLGAWSYSKNRVTLHTDETLLPPLRRGWASWNFKRGARGPVVTYWMNNLQSISSSTTYCVTLNDTPKESTILKAVTFDHPVYTAQSIASQRRLSELQGGGRSFFCGSYFGYGFHEDGCLSGVEVAKRLGVLWS